MHWLLMQAKTAEESGDYTAAAEYNMQEASSTVEHREIICGTVNYVVCGIISVAVIIYFRVVNGVCHYSQSRRLINTLHFVLSRVIRIHILQCNTVCHCS